MDRRGNMKSQILVVLVALSPFAAAAGVVSFAYQDEGGIMALFGHNWLEDYPRYTMDENPCPGFQHSRTAIPEALIVMVRSADEEPVPDAALSILQEAADEALPTMDIRVVRYGHVPYVDGKSTATVHVHVLTDGTLKTWDGMKINGFYCKGHVVQSVFLDHPDFSKAVFLHEFGHYLGLCHDDASWMQASMGPGGIDDGAKRFTPSQQRTLEQWARPGAAMPEPCLHQ